MNDPDNSPLSFWQVLLSVLAAAFGVQSGKNLSATASGDSALSIADTPETLTDAVILLPNRRAARARRAS